MTPRWNMPRSLLLAQVSALGLLVALCGPAQAARPKAAKPPAADPAPPPPPPAPPPDPATVARNEQARGLIRQAGRLLDQGDPQSAVAILQQAARLSPDPTIQYNLGVACAAARRPTEAAAAFAAFQAALDRDPALRAGLSPARLAEVRDQLDGYRKTLARLRVRVDGPAAARAQALLDGKLVTADASAASDGAKPGGAPSIEEERWLLPGEHTLELRGDVAPQSQRLTLAAGEARESTLLAAPRPEPLHFIPAEGPKAPTPLYQRWWVWAAVGGGVVLAASLIGLGAAGRFDRVASGSDLPPLDVGR